MSSSGRGFVTLAVTAGLVLASLAQDAAPSRKLDLPVPIGHEVKGLRVPLRNNEGNMDLQFDIETARRLDQRNVEMRTASILTFSKDTFQPEVKIDLRNSVMNLENNVIRSNEPIVVTRNDFQLTGDGLEFNSKTREGRVIGNVRMLIYNHSELDRKPDKRDTGTQAP
jgi:hypothetical protein